MAADMICMRDTSTNGSRMLRLSISQRTWPLKSPFTISRGARSEAHTLVVTLGDDEGNRGSGEAVPYARYDETMQAAMDELEAARPAIEAGITHDQIPALLKLRAARNALDCALWDLRAKQQGKPAWQLAALDAPRPLTTAYTISLASPGEMARVAGENSSRPLLKLKLGSASAADDMARLKAVRAAAPGSRLIVDANEGWREDDLPMLLETCAENAVKLVEQPLPAERDAVLSAIPRPVPVCADESFHDAADLPRLAGRYDAVNIKLDKSGGLTPALEAAERALAAGFSLMCGCMLASSLAMAPAFLVARKARWTDLDGPLLLASDAHPPIKYQGSTMYPPERELWG